MLEKRDYRTVNGVGINNVWTQTIDWWQRAGFAVYNVGPGHLVGASYYSRIGLRREIELRLQESGGSLYIDLSFRARLTDEGAVGGVVAAVVFWPVAAVGGAVSWSEYENEANALIANFWFFLSQITGRPMQILAPYPQPPITPYQTAPQAPPPAAKKCSRCGSGLAAEWRACPSCGQMVS